MSETKTRNFNNFTEFSHLSTPEGSGLIIVRASRRPDIYLAQMVAHMLSNNSSGLTDLYPVIIGEETISEIRERAQTEYTEHGYGRAGAIMIDETYNDAFLSNTTTSRLASLAREMDIKVVLITRGYSSIIEQDAKLIVEVIAGEASSHTLRVIKNRSGATRNIEFAYEDPS